MAPTFLLQIADHEGAVVRLPAGGTLEADLVKAFTDAITARGVGLMRTEAHVKADIAAGIADAIYALKAKTRLLV